MTTTEHRLRTLLAGVLEQAEGDVMALPSETPLLGTGLGLDSFTGMRLLNGVLNEFGVDVAAEDLNLDSLESIGTLAGFLEARAPSTNP